MFKSWQGMLQILTYVWLPISTTTLKSKVFWLVSTIKHNQWRLPTIRGQCDTLADATLALLHPLFSACVLLLLSIPTQNLNPICQMLGDFILIIVFRFDLMQLLAFVIESFETKVTSNVGLVYSHLVYSHF